MGVAFQYSHRGYFANVAEVSVDDLNRVKVNKVWVAGDIGRPDRQPEQRDQPEPGRRGRGHESPDGMGDRDRGRQGRAEQLPSVPDCAHRAGAAEVDVHFVVTDNPPTGLGEPALPPTIPALANAIFAATGKRIRSLPISKQGFRWA